jgi:hypothetical protein
MTILEKFLFTEVSAFAEFSAKVEKVFREVQMSRMD